jgi:hypothetical protein
MGIKGTGAGKEVGGGPAASRVGGDIPKNIGESDNIKWCRVHIKERMEVTVMFQRTRKGQRGSAGGVRGSGREQSQKGGQHALGVEQSGGRRSGVGEGTTRDWGGHG